MVFKHNSYLNFLAVLVPRDMRSWVRQHALEHEIFLAFHRHRLRQFLREVILHFFTCYTATPCKRRLISKLRQMAISDALPLEVDYPASCVRLYHASKPVLHPHTKFQQNRPIRNWVIATYYLQFGHPPPSWIQPEVHFTISRLQWAHNAPSYQISAQACWVIDDSINFLGVFFAREGTIL